MDCSICFEGITKATGKAELSCSHSFHLNCLSQWFIKNENCPYCRHGANDMEKMARGSIESEDEDEESEDESESEDENEYEALASIESAAHKFRQLRWDMKKSDFETYAATRISAWFRGIQSRSFFMELECWKDDEKELKEAIEQAEKNFKQAKNAQLFYKKMASVPRFRWKAFAATMIQAAWRGKKQAKEYKEQKLSKAMMAGLTIQVPI